MENNNTSVIYLHKVFKEHFTLEAHKDGERWMASLNFMGEGVLLTDISYQSKEEALQVAKDNLIAMAKRAQELIP